MSYNIEVQDAPQLNRVSGQHAGWTPAAEQDGAARWFAVNTLPNSEKRAHINLVRQGWQCFCPVIAKTIRSGRRLMTQPRPLFPSYLFVRLDPQQCRWRSVDGTFGVRAIVKSGDAPAPLPSGCIETLISMADADGKVTFASSLIAGENVRFLAGPFAGFIGQLEHLDPYGRITVLLDLLGRTTRITAAASEVLPADHGASS